MTTEEKDTPVTTVEQALGDVGFPMEYQGKTYTIGPLDIDCKKAFVKWCKNTAVAGVLGLRGQVPTKDFLEALALVGKRNDTGFYNWGIKGPTQALITELIDEAGSVAFFRCLLHQNEMPMEKVGELMETVGEDVLAAIVKKVVMDSSPRPIPSNGKPEGEGPKA